MTRLKINVEAEDDAAAVRVLCNLRCMMSKDGTLNKAGYVYGQTFGNATADVERFGAKCPDCGSDPIAPGEPCPVCERDGAEQTAQPCVLADATKATISQRGQALLQWDYDSHGFSSYSVQLPEDVVDQILAWRDNEREARKGAE